MFMFNLNYMLIIYGLINLIDQLLIGGFRIIKVRLNIFFLYIYINFWIYRKDI